MAGTIGDNINEAIELIIDLLVTAFRIPFKLIDLIPEWVKAIFVIITLIICYFIVRRFIQSHKNMDHLR